MHKSVNMNKSDMYTTTESANGNGMAISYVPNERITTDSIEVNILASYTFGEEMVGLGRYDTPEVTAIKREFADKIDAINNKGVHGTYVNNMIKGEAIRKLVDACLWSVKFHTL